MKHHLPDCVSKWIVPGLIEDAKTPGEQLQHRLGLQAEQESQIPSCCACSGAPVHVDTPLLCTPPHLLPEHIRTCSVQQSIYCQLSDQRILMPPANSRLCVVSWMLLQEGLVVWWFALSWLQIEWTKISSLAGNMS